jgi:hypothetical protein
MRCFQRLRNLNGNLQSFFERHRVFASEAFPQRLTGNQLHHQIMCAVRFFQPMNRGDVGMVQRRQHLRFALKASKSIGIVRERFGQDFDRHIAAELSIVRFVDFAHPARTNMH